jgi:hypothetical protein
MEITFGPLEESAMEKLTWLQNLQKSAPILAPSSRPASDPLLAAGPFDTSNDDPPILDGRMSKVHDDGFADAPDVVGDLIKNRLFQPETAAPPLEKRAMTEGAPMQMFARLSKVDEAQRLVYGIATSETPDRDDEILDYENSKPYFEAWSNSVKKDTNGASVGNLREMHGAVAAGKLSQIVFNDAAKQVEICAKVVDDACWKKVLERVYSGFSIGGKYISTRKDGNLTRFVASPSEVSLVDRPSCPTATFQLVKVDGTTEICKFNDRHGGPMTADPHMATLHRRHSTHFTDTAQSHKKMAAHHETLAAHFKKAADDEGTAAHKAHAALAEEHHDRAMKDSSLAAWHHNSMEECDKAVAAAMNKAADAVPLAISEDQVRAVFLKLFGNMVQPTPVVAVVPTHPEHDRIGVMAVPRAGQRAVPAPSAAAPAVPLEFVKLFSTEDNQETIRQ